MWAFLVRALKWAPVQFLGAFGIKFGYAAGLAVLVTTALATVVNYTNALAADMLNFLLLCGFGQALNIIGAALVVSAGMNGQKITAIKR